MGGGWQTGNAPTSPNTLFKLCHTLYTPYKVAFQVNGHLFQSQINVPTILSAAF